MMPGRIDRTPARRPARTFEEKENRRETMEKDPVCGMSVDPAKAAGSSQYQGRTIYFCAPGCKRKFDANPSQYLK